MLSCDAFTNAGAVLNLKKKLTIADKNSRFEIEQRGDAQRLRRNP